MMKILKSVENDDSLTAGVMVNVPSNLEVFKLVDLNLLFLVLGLTSLSIHFR